MTSAVKCGIIIMRNELIFPRRRRGKIKQHSVNTACLAVGNRGTCPSTHYIRVDFLEQVMLKEIHRLTQFAGRYEDEFVQAIAGHSQKAAETERRVKQREFDTLQARDRELDRLFERIYEDNVAEKIDDERFARMSKNYTEEQAGIAARMKILKAEIEKCGDKTVTADVFLATVRRYTRTKKLTPRMLNELIDRIEVYQSEKIDGVHVQRLTIHYNCVGTIDIPELDKLNSTDVLMRTRKGVAVSYAPMKQAI